MTVTILGTVPSKANNYRFGNGRVYKPKALTDYENSFLLSLLAFCTDPYVVILLHRTMTCFTQHDDHGFPH